MQTKPLATIKRRTITNLWEHGLGSELAIKIVSETISYEKYLSPRHTTLIQDQRVMIHDQP